jgi:two-component system response regulator NreC
LAQGRAFVDLEAIAKTAPAAVVPTSIGGALETLSERELEVFRGLAHGHTNQAIADRLTLSVKTVESYRARLMTKLGCRTRAELTRRAIEAGLLTDEPPEN